MSAGISATTAASISTSPTYTAQAEEHNTPVGLATTTLIDKHTVIAATHNETTNLCSFRVKSSADTQQIQHLQQNQDLQTLSQLPACAINPENVPSSANICLSSPDDTTCEQQEEEDFSGSVELRDALRSTNGGETHQNSIAGHSQDNLSPGLSLLQAAAASSPPPHSYRHSRAYRHFKNPPQPHMCIRTTTETAEELFINVLSWTRIVIPQEPSDPIPLYGGMRVPPGSPRSPPIVFAVMANPEVLKDSGRHSKDPEERRAMVELMCDFVEAMNPGIKLIRNAVILKDRDISGELKDVWNAVQAQRDREREEQMLQQRQQQQQHFHTLTTNGSGSANGTSTVGGGGLTSTGSGLLPVQQQQQMFSQSILGAFGEGSSPPRSRKILLQETQANENSSLATNIGDSEAAIVTQQSMSMLADELDNKMSIRNGGGGGDGTQKHLILECRKQTNQATLAKDSLSNGNEFKNFIDSNIGEGSAGGVGVHKNDLNNQINANNCITADIKTLSQNLHTNSISSNITPAPPNASTSDNLSKTSVATNAEKGILNVAHLNAVSSVVTTTASKTTTTPNINSQTVVVTAAPPPPTKKEKLGGFLPNGCIFPRFTKNNKHKDKDKETKTKDKEKNALLSALKKSKDKKSQHNNATVNANQDQQQLNELNNTNNTSATANSFAANNYTANVVVGQHQHQHQQSSTATAVNNHHNGINKSGAVTNCLQDLENEVKRLDINHIESNSKFTSSSASLPNSNIVPSNSPVNVKDSNTNSSSSGNNTGVGVH